MRIVLINQFFWPDSAATSQYLTDLANSLAEQGHHVEVICGASAYASTGADGEAPPVVCHRIACAPFVKGAAGRMWSYLSFFAGAFRTAMDMPKSDVIVTLTTPPMLSILGTLLKGRRFEKHFIWEMDLFPEALAGVGWVRESSWIVRFLGWIADWSRRKSDGIIALGECMRRRLISRGIPASKIHVAENWADGRSIMPLPARRTGPLVLLYSGNLGRTHDINTILDAMESLKDNPRFHFRFVGGGPRRKELADRCSQKNITNISFAPYCRRDDLGSSLREGDIGLVTQRQECLGTVVPSKVYGLMAAGRPILYIGPRTSTSAEIVHRFHCGWQVDCGEGARVADLLQELEANRDLVIAAGIRGRRALVEHYDLPQGVGRICGIISGSSGLAADCVASTSV